MLSCFDCPECKLGFSFFLAWADRHPREGCQEPVLAAIVVPLQWGAVLWERGGERGDLVGRWSGHTLLVFFFFFFLFRLKSLLSLQVIADPSSEEATWTKNAFHTCQGRFWRCVNRHVKPRKMFDSELQTVLHSRNGQMLFFNMKWSHHILPSLVPLIHVFRLSCPFFCNVIQINFELDQSKTSAKSTKTLRENWRTLTWLISKEFYSSSKASASD